MFEDEKPKSPKQREKESASPAQEFGHREGTSAENGENLRQEVRTHPQYETYKKNILDGNDMAELIRQDAVVSKDEIALYTAVKQSFQSLYGDRGTHISNDEIDALVHLRLKLETNATRSLTAEERSLADSLANKKDQLLKEEVAINRDKIHQTTSTVHDMKGPYTVTNTNDHRTPEEVKKANELHNSVDRTWEQANVLRRTDLLKADEIGVIQKGLNQLIPRTPQTIEMQEPNDPFKIIGQGSKPRDYTVTPSK